MISEHEAKRIATRRTAAVVLVGVAVGSPLIWSFVFCGIGAVAGLIATFGWLPSGWFAVNMTNLFDVAAIITLPIVGYLLWRWLPRIRAAELNLALNPPAVPPLPVGSAAGAKPTR